MAQKSKWSSWQHIHLEGNLISVDVLDLVSKNQAAAQSDSAYQLPSGITTMDKIGLSYKTAIGLYTDYKRKLSSDKNDPWDLTREFITRFFSQCLEWNIEVTRKLDADNRSFPIRRTAYGRIPIVTVPGESSLDKAESRYAITNGQKNVSAFQMVQQYLSAAGASKWGIVANGSKFRLLRSSTALSKPQYLEFDLGAILEDDFYNEYSIIWKFFHVSRIRDIANGTDLEIWEEWRKTAIDSGERIRDRLRVGVSKALQIFGTGFLKDNPELREKFAAGSIKTEDYYHQLLRLIYRFLFLFVTEERYSEKGIRLIFNPDSDFVARNTYDKGYSLARLKPIIRQSRYRNSLHDLWEVQKVVFYALEKGEPLLALPALGGMFSESTCPDISRLILSNRYFLSAMDKLRWSSQKSRPVWIDYKNLGTQELGSVYESLLEMVPVVDIANNTFRFIDFDDEETNAGNARKTSGSYYTPDFLVDQLIKTALIPTVEEKLKNSDNAEKTILNLSVVDPACGSGHFLIAAASTLAVYLSRVRDGGDTVTGYREAYRDIISNCIYGVDINPMAVELAKMALWLEGYEPGKPLSFLDSHIKCGNSLMGVFDISILDKGIPTDAYEPTGSDDKDLCKSLKKKNQNTLKTLRKKDNGPDLFGKVSFSSLLNIDSMPENTMDEIEAKTKAYKEFEQRFGSSWLMTAANYYMAAFFAEKKNEKIVPSSDTLSRLFNNQVIENDKESINYSKHLSLRNSYFHWKLEFPLVFKKGGFDIVLGNPPWDILQLKTEEFFASKVPEISKAQNDSIRKKMITKLANGNGIERAFYDEYLEAIRNSVVQNTFVHISSKDSGQYPLSGKKKVNMYALFTELASKIVSQNGAVGIIVPTGIATDDSTKDLFRSFVDKNTVNSVYDFVNGGCSESKIFPAIDGRIKFCLLTLCRTEYPDFAFFLHDVKELEDERRHYPLSSEDIKLINPNTLTLPLIRSKMDYDIVKKIYNNSTIIWDDNAKNGNVFNFSFLQMFNMATDSNLFHDQPTQTSLPLYEGKFIQLYDHRFNSYEGDTDSKGKPVESYVSDSKKKDINYEITPQYWIEEKEVLYKYSDAPQDIKDAWYKGNALKTAKKDLTPSLFDDDTALDQNQLDTIVRNNTKKWCFSYRMIARSTDTRTVISGFFPLSGAGHSLTILKSDCLENMLLLCCNLSSFVLDYVARIKVGGTNLSYFYFKQFPIISPSAYSHAEKKFVTNSCKKLVATSNTIAEALDCEISIWNGEERTILKSRLDAFYAMKYGLSREELEFILDPDAVMGKDYPTVTFPAVKADDISQYGEYRTKRLILEAYDELMERGIWDLK